MTATGEGRSFYRIKNKKQGSDYRVQTWRDIRGLADWMCCVSGQEELQGTEIT